jgi:hypothetical protein
MSLKASEDRWLKKRDRLFASMDRKLDQPEQEGDHIPDVEDFMPVFEKKAEFIKKRVLYLIGKIKN